MLLGCQQTELSKTHGISYLEIRQKLIVVNKTNKNDAVIILGPPATKGMTDNNLWIYIERTISRGNLLKLGKNYIKKNNVLVLEFNNYGVVYKKEFYDKDKMKNISFAKNITQNELKKLRQTDLNQIHFAWAGGHDRGQPHYYRIHGQSFFVEYDNVQNNANHIHSIWRHLEDDFGVDLLRHHYRYGHSHH